MSKFDFTLSGKRVTSEDSGLPTPPTLLLPFLHLTSRPPRLPLPQDGAEHSGTSNLSNIHLYL